MVKRATTDRSNVAFAIILVVVFFALASDNDSSPLIITQSESPAIGSLINADVVFTGTDMYVKSNSVSSQSVRVFQGSTDLGSKSLSSGTLNVIPDEEYTFYFFMNATTPSSTYYVDRQEYTAKLQESTDTVTGNGCAIETNPIIIVRNSAGAIQSAAANPESIGASSTADIEVTVKSHGDRCYGTPTAEKDNVACFAYSTTAFSLVKSNRPYITPPRSLTGLDLGTLSCYSFNKLKSGESDTFTISLTSTSTDPTNAHNISVFVDDIGLDLHGTTLDEVWDFTDEEGNQLGNVKTATPDGTIRIS